MRINRHSAWPKHPGSTYRRVTGRGIVAHAFNAVQVKECQASDGPQSTYLTVALCGVSLEPQHEPPIENSTMICIDCQQKVIILPEPPA